MNMIPVMIVDDEPLMRKGLQSLIDWQALGCQVVAAEENGLSAIQNFPKYHPKIVISDIKMPLMDGLALSQWLYVNHPDAKIILLTAFSDFSYAQKAIEYGVSNYVVKTGKMEDIVDAVHRCKAQLQKQQSTEQSIESHFGNLVKSVMDGTLRSGPTLAEAAGRYRIDLDSYVVLAIRFSAKLLGDDSAYYQQQQNLRQFLKKQLPEPMYFVQCGRTESYAIIPGITESTAYGSCTDCAKIYQSMTQYPIFFGCSRQQYAIASLPTALEQSSAALGRSFYDGEPVHLPDPHPAVRQKNQATRFDALREALQMGNTSGAVAVLEQLCSQQKNAQIPEAQAKEECFTVLTTCIRSLDSSGLTLADLDVDEAQWRRDIRESCNFAECTALQQNLVKQTALTISQHLYAGIDVVVAAQSYIDSHFRENISLNDVATAIHVSPSYLSRYFKQRTAMTLSDAITSRKIDLAKKLLQENKLKIYEIAQMVGYTDNTYFSYVFKKVTGISAKDYQSSMQLSNVSKNL